MNAPDLIARLALAGVQLHVPAQGQLVAGPPEALTDELRAMLRAHKAELLAALVGPPDDPGREARRHNVLRMLAKDPALKRAATFDTDADAEAESVILTLAVRSIGICELRIPKSKFDAWAILQALQAAEQ